MKHERSTTWVTPMIILAIVLVAFCVAIFAYHNNLYYFVIVALGYYIFQTLIVLSIFASSRHEIAKTSWLVISLVLPLIGPLIYFIFGRRYKYRLEYPKYLASNEWWRQQQAPSTWCETPVLGRQNRIIFESIGESSFKNHHATKVEFHAGGDVAFVKMFAALISAKKFILMEIYIAKPGEIFEQLRSILIQKAGEGVDVKILVDDFGRWALPWYELKELRDAKIHVGIFGKTRFPFVGAENGYRSHRKFLVVDGQIVLTGGMNISDEYAHFSKKYGYWYDLNCSLTGQVVKDYSLLFVADWKKVTNKLLPLDVYALDNPAPHGADSNVILIEGGPNNKFPLIKNTFINLIYQAHKRIWLTTPYFVPSGDLLNALQHAALRGVDVRIFIPGLPDKKSVYLSTTKFGYELAQYGVHFYEIRHAFLHSKLGLCDDVGWTGTVNLDIRSFYSQFEIENFFTGAACVDIEKIFQEYERFAVPKFFTSWTHPTIYNKLKELAIKLFLPLL